MTKLTFIGLGFILANAALVLASDDVATDRLGAADVPYVEGRITILGPWQDGNPIKVGFVGKGADGKERDNLAGFSHGPTVTYMYSWWGLRVRTSNACCVDLPTWNATCTTMTPQLTTVFKRDNGYLGFRHVKMTPGDYLIYVRLGDKGPVTAWKQVALKEGDQLTADLKIDPATMGKLVVKLPDDEANDEEDRWLSIIPLEFDCSPNQRWHFDAAKVKKGDKTVAVDQVPAGKYRAIHGKSQAEVEVFALRENFVTLAHDGSDEN
jgi:hypothetical protein